MEQKIEVINDCYYLCTYENGVRVKQEGRGHTAMHKIDSHGNVVKDWEHSFWKQFDAPNVQGPGHINAGPAQPGI
jgi:hypothetical protein